MSGPGSPGARAASVAPAVLAAGILIAQQVAGKATRDALFLSNFDVRTLPLVMGASALTSLCAVLGFARALARWSPAAVMPAALGASALLLLLEWALSLVSLRLAALAVYLHIAMFGAVLVSGFWTLVSERYDPHTAKRVVGRIGVGANVGGILGGLLTWRIASLIDVRTMLVVLSGSNLVCLAAVLLAWPMGAGGEKRAPPAEEEARSGLRILEKTPYLRYLAVMVGLAGAVEAMLDYVLGSAAAARFSAGGQLMSFFAAFHAAAGLLAFAVQAALGRASLHELGIAATVAFRPAAVTVAGLAAFLSPGLWSAVLVRGADIALRNSLFRSGYELLYTPLPPHRKRPTKAIVDVGLDRLGVAAGSVIVLAVLALGAPAPRALAALSVASALAVLALTPRLHRGYVAALAESLRSGEVRLDPREAVDRATRATIIETQLGLDRQALLREIEARRRGQAPPEADPLLQAVADLRSEDPERIRRVLGAEDVDPLLVGHLIPLLARDAVSSDVERALRKLAPRVTGQLLDALLDPQQRPIVRRRLPRVIKAGTTQRAADGLLLGLHDERFDVRFRCARALADILDQNPAIAVPADLVFAAALRELQAPDLDSRGLEHVFVVLSLALERQPLRIAYRALSSSDPSLRGTALEYLENVLPEWVRRPLWPRLGAQEAPATTPRPTEQIREELLRSTLVASEGLGDVKGKPRPESA